MSAQNFVGKLEMSRDGDCTVESNDYDDRLARPMRRVLCKTNKREVLNQLFKELYERVRLLS